MTSASSDIILERLMSLHPKLIDLTLDRVWRLLERLGNPQQSLPPVIHIAGTNGKGSTQAMIRAGLEAEGNVVHAYTSPHLVRFHERITLAGELIEEDYLSRLLEECEEANAGDPITFFEITTVAAILAFSRVPADYCIVEVGLGGRLDSTNVFDAPAMTVITPVSLDHQQFLGETLTEIAGEKAGILKRNVFCVVAEQEPAALEKIEDIAAEVGATLKAQGREWMVWEENGRLVYQDDYGLLDLPPPNLIGAHQVQNAGVAISALRLLGMGDAAAIGAMENAVWPARLQRLRKGPLPDLLGPENELWLDGGHNPAAGKALVEGLGRLADRPTHLIIGMLATKDAGGYLREVAANAQSVTAIPIQDADASFDPKELANHAGRFSENASFSDSAESAIEALPKHQGGCRVVICGSLYLAGEILRENG